MIVDTDEVFEAFGDACIAAGPERCGVADENLLGGMDVVSWTKNLTDVCRMLQSALSRRLNAMSIVGSRRGKHRLVHPDRGGGHPLQPECMGQIFVYYTPLLLQHSFQWYLGRSGATGGCKRHNGLCTSRQPIRPSLRFFDGHRSRRCPRPL